MSLGKLVPLRELYPADATALSPGTQVEATLKNYKGLVALSAEAIEQFKKGYIFDPIVAENACQIRAGLFTDLINDEKIDGELDHYLQQIEDIRKKLDLLQVSKKTTTSLKATLETGGCDCSLPKKIHLLIAAYILTLAREGKRGFVREKDGNVNIEEKVEQTAKLVKEKKFPKIIASNLEKKAKEKLSHGSVEYLQKEVKKLPEPERKRLEDLVTGDRVKTTACHLLTAPGLPAVEIVLKRALAKGTPLALTVKLVDSETILEEGSLELFYKPDETHSIYVPTPLQEIRGKQGVIQLEAVCIAHPLVAKEELKEAILKRDVSEIVFASFAAHPQYGGNLKNEKGPQDEKTERLAIRARQEGLCKENPSFCRIYHVYAKVLK